MTLRSGPPRLLGLLGLLVSAALLAPFSSAQAGGPITSAQLVAGTIAGPTFAETWTFSGTTGDRVLISAVTTSGVVNTNIRLRNPASGK